MAITRVSDAQVFSFLTARSGKLQVSIRDLQEQIASGKRLLTPDQDPVGATRVVQGGTTLAALGQYGETSRFGGDVLGAEDDALGDAYNVLVRAEEIATQQGSSLLGPSERAAAREEVHGLLQALTVVGNQDLAGRRLFGGLALNAPPPFADPDGTGYSAATAYTGSAYEAEVKIGSSSIDRVRVTTRGDTVFTGALVALEALETALATGGDVIATLPTLAQARATIGGERASVGARQGQLIDRDTQVRSLTTAEQGAVSRMRDADLVSVITQLTQAQTALQALLAAGAQIARTSIADLVPL